MPDSLRCKFTDEQVAYVEALPDCLALFTAALDTLDDDAWADWVNLSMSIAGWSTGVREHHGYEVAFRAELMILQALVAPMVRGWSSSEVLRLYEPVNGFWEA